MIDGVQKGGVRERELLIFIRIESCREISFYSNNSKEGGPKKLTMAEKLYEDRQVFGVLRLDLNWEWKVKVE